MNESLHIRTTFRPDLQDDTSVVANAYPSAENAHLDDRRARKCEPFIRNAAEMRTARQTSVIGHAQVATVRQKCGPQRLGTPTVATVL